MVFRFLLHNSRSVPLLSEDFMPLVLCFENNKIWLFTKKSFTVTYKISADSEEVYYQETVKYGGKTFKVTSVANNALKNKTKVTSVTISGNITKIGKNAFYGCKKLKTITIETKSLKSVGSKVFKGILSTATVKVPTSKYASYKKLFDGKGLGKKNSIVINPVNKPSFSVTGMPVNPSLIIIWYALYIESVSWITKFLW